MALDLAHHVGRRVGGQRDLAVQLEAVDGLEQPDGAHLLDVLQRLAAIRVAAGQRADERQVALHQLLAGRLVAVLVEAAQQLAVLLAGQRLARVLGRPHRCPSTSFSSRTMISPSVGSSTP